MPTTVPSIFVLALLVCCARTQTHLEFDKVHPDVFAMVPCWLSDTANPVVTEVNLDAVVENENQFDPSEIRHRGEWFEVDRAGQGRRAYRILRAEPPRYRLEFCENGGGSLTTSELIEVHVERRVIRVDGSPTSVRVMRVLSIEPLSAEVPRADRIAQARRAPISVD